ncbi:MAG: TadE/TadG family type IV pilus assembly protein [Alphaproteobacteria bacterium]|nr:TadE/TadG family type IV pilus assembly protein [Alphaproteobacteria bacterium]
MKQQTRLMQLIRDNSGVAAIELAVVLPMLMTLFLGVVEISNFVLVNERTEKMAHTIADVVSQGEAITTAELENILSASSEIMKPFPFSSLGHVIITSVHREVNDTPKVAWQYEGGGTLTNTHSNFGGAGFASPLPEGFVLNERETVIIAEVFYNHENLVTNMFNGSNPQLYKYAFYKPRLGALNVISTQ